MSHHFVTVCVVCVLCAAHAPCSAHTDVQAKGGVPLPQDSGGILPDSRRLDDSLQPLKNQIGSKEIVRIKEVRYIDGGDDNSSKERLRKRRHTVIDRSHIAKQIFEEYGNGDSMTIEGFEKLLDKFQLIDVISKLDDQNRRHPHQTNETLSQVDDSNGQADNRTGKEAQIVQNVDREKSKQRCITSRELLTQYSEDKSYLNSTDNQTTLPGWLFERICPAIVYQLVSSEGSGCIEVPKNWHPVVSHQISHNTWQVWVYSSISIVIISLCGLLGVVVIPVMNKTYYHQLIQFLVALAVGTLCGDALIHLLPHAMMPSSGHEHGHSHSHQDHDHHDHHDHNSASSASVNLELEHDLNMWKGFVAMLGLVVFFFTEKALTMIGEWRKFRQRRNKLPLRVKVMREPDTSGSGNNSVSDKHCKHKYSSYPYCYGEITTETQDNHHNRHHNSHQLQAAIEEEKPLTSNSNTVLKPTNEEVEVEKKQDSEDWKLDETTINNHTKKKNDIVDEPALNETESYTVIIREHENKHHGHTHSHGHVHSAPESMSSVAWMVIMGDGLHNFTDGMTIGAAFAANIAGGFSTAIAVLCHELPHELGDFAVLLKAGMSAKQAVFYNLLSSVLCLFGMIVGILVGADPAATSWIFAAAAGTFIYIALVDMIPELTSSHSAEGGSQWQCLLQALGLVTGLGIMLIIALYEHDLKNIFSD